MLAQPLQPYQRSHAWARYAVRRFRLTTRTPNLRRLEVVSRDERPSPTSRRNPKWPRRSLLDRVLTSFPIPASCYSESRSGMRMVFVRVSQPCSAKNGAPDCATTNQFPISEGARPQLVLPQRGAARQALPALTSDSGQDPGKPRYKPIAERLALLPKTAERKQHWFLCRRPE